MATAGANTTIIQFFLGRDGLNYKSIATEDFIINEQDGKA